MIPPRNLAIDFKGLITFSVVEKQIKIIIALC